MPGAAQAVDGELDVAAVLERRDEIIHDLDDSPMLPWLEERGIALYRGWGRLDGEKRVVVGEETIEARRAVILAGGTTPRCRRSTGSPRPTRGPTARRRRRKHDPRAAWSSWAAASSASR